MGTPDTEWEVAEQDKVFDCFEDGCGECTVCKYLDFIDWAESVGKPEGSTIKRNELVEDYLKRKQQDISSRDTYWKERMKSAVEKKQKQVSGEKRLNAGLPNTQVFLDGYNHALNDIITLIERI